MASEVVVNKRYSNNEFFDATIAEMASQCHQKEHCSFIGSVYIPEDYLAKINNCIEYLCSITCGTGTLPAGYQDTWGQKDQSSPVSCGNGWLSISVNYHVMKPANFRRRSRTALGEDGISAPRTICAIPCRSLRIPFFNYIYAPEERKIKLCFHISAASAIKVTAAQSSVQHTQLFRNTN
jgi:hypothetical protein